MGELYNARYVDQCREAARKVGRHRQQAEQRLLDRKTCADAHNDCKGVVVRDHFIRSHVSLGNVVGNEPELVELRIDWRTVPYFDQD